MKIYELNTSAEYRQIVNHIKKGMQEIFLRSYDPDGDIYIVNHFPGLTDGFGETELLIFISITKTNGNYFLFQDNGRKNYLNNIVIGIKMIYDDSITDADDTSFYSSYGCFDYIDELENESNNFKKFSSYCKKPLKNCPYFYWVVTKGSRKAFSNDYILFNTSLDVPKLLFSACRRAIYKQRINSFFEVSNLEEIVHNYIDEANKRAEIGILTKKRIDKITDQKVSTPLRVLNNHGKSISIIQGKAGCGKTLMLSRVFNNVIVSKHHCRFLSFNNLLIFDLKHCLCRVPTFRNTNAYIHTLHYFFYHLSKKMGIHSLFTEDRLTQLMNVCIQRLDVADKYLRTYNSEMGKWPNNESFWEKFNTYIDLGDKIEITKYLKFLDVNNYNKETLTELRKAYIQERKRLLSNELGRDLFINDYNKVLENMYLMLDNPQDFYEKYKIKERRELLNLMSRTDRKKEDCYSQEYSFDTFNQDIQNTIMHTKGWSKNILIDEAQDCNNYEKLILMKIYGAKNIIITSGGKDQLIRTSLVTDWTHALESIIPSDVITLPGRSYRQKANVVKFVNAFAEHYKVATAIKSASETQGLGRVIIDIRNEVRGFSNETFNLIREEGKVLGCSDYENCLFLLPTNGYTSKTKTKTISIDELDNVDIIDKTTNRTLDISNPEIQIWNGIVDNKNKLSVPAANQTRFIYYESCRGLEAWNVLCVDLDSFFYNMRSSQEARLYASSNRNLFSTENELKDEYALHWIYMAITRPIDTLYIKLSVPNNDFSKTILEIAKNCNSQILANDTIKTDSDDLPF